MALPENIALEPTCTTRALFAPNITTAEQCIIALEHCEAASMLNFYKLYFCTL